MNKSVSPAVLDSRDLDLAMRDLVDGREALAAAHQITDHRERREALKVAVGKLALAARWIDDVVDRRG